MSTTNIEHKNTVAIIEELLQGHVDEREQHVVRAATIYQLLSWANPNKNTTCGDGEKKISKLKIYIFK